MTHYKHTFLKTVAIAALLATPTAAFANSHADMANEAVKVMEPAHKMEDVNVSVMYDGKTKTMENVDVKIWKNDMTKVMADGDTQMMNNVKVKVMHDGKTKVMENANVNVMADGSVKIMTTGKMKKHMDKKHMDGAKHKMIDDGTKVMIKEGTHIDLEDGTKIMKKEGKTHIMKDGKKVMMKDGKATVGAILQSNETAVTSTSDEDVLMTEGELKMKSAVSMDEDDSTIEDNVTVVPTVNSSQITTVTCPVGTEAQTDGTCMITGDFEADVEVEADAEAKTDDAE